MIWARILDDEEWWATAVGKGKAVKLRLRKYRGPILHAFLKRRMSYYDMKREEAEFYNRGIHELDAQARDWWLKQFPMRNKGLSRPLTARKKG